MKKQDRQRDLWLLRQRENKSRHKKQRAWAKLHGICRDPAILLNQHNPEQKQPREKRLEIVLPDQLDLDKNYERTVTHFTNVRLASQRGLRGFRLRYLSFDKIQSISPSAALLLASEIDRWNQAIGGRLRAKTEAWHPPVKQLLCEMGFFELLGIKRPSGHQDVINTTFLPFIRGNVEDRTNGGLLAKELRKKIEAVAGIEIKKHLLFEGLSEALTNVSQHAYPKRSRRKRRYRPWWMSAAYERDTRIVTVSFYDHGRTIPGTLQESEKLVRWKHRISRWDEGGQIRAAMTLGRSSTGKAGRGRGLKNFLELIKEHPDSTLRIFSRNGLLVVQNRGNGSLKYRTAVVVNPLRGTLIEWRFVPIIANVTDP